MRSTRHLSDDELRKLAQKPLSESASKRIHEAIEDDRWLLAINLKAMEEEIDQTIITESTRRTPPKTKRPGWRSKHEWAKEKVYSPENEEQIKPILPLLNNFENSVENMKEKRFLLFAFPNLIINYRKVLNISKSEGISSALREYIKDYLWGKLLPVILSIKSIINITTTILIILSLIAAISWKSCSGCSNSSITLPPRPPEKTSIEKENNHPIITPKTDNAHSFEMIKEKEILLEKRRKLKSILRTDENGNIHIYRVRHNGANVTSQIPILLTEHYLLLKNRDGHLIKLDLASGVTEGDYFNLSEASLDWYGYPEKQLLGGNMNPTSVNQSSDILISYYANSDGGIDTDSIQFTDLKKGISHLFSHGYKFTDFVRRYFQRHNKSDSYRKNWMQCQDEIIFFENESGSELGDMVSSLNLSAGQLKRYFMQSSTKGSTRLLGCLNSNLFLVVLNQVSSEYRSIDINLLSCPMNKKDNECFVMDSVKDISAGQIFEYKNNRISASHSTENKWPILVKSESVEFIFPSIYQNKLLRLNIEEIDREVEKFTVDKNIASSGNNHIKFIFGPDEAYFIIKKNINLNVQRDAYSRGKQILGHFDYLKSEVTILGYLNFKKSVRYRYSYDKVNRGVFILSGEELFFIRR